MDFVGIVFVLNIGILFIYISIKLSKGKNINYDTLSKTIATVLHQEDFAGNRWIVEFLDEEGNVMLGMDDYISLRKKTFKKYKYPTVNSKEEIYYWKYDGSSSYYLNSKKVEYYIHFLNDNYYLRYKKYLNKCFSISFIVGVSFILIGIILLFSLLKNCLLFIEIV